MMFEGGDSYCLVVQDGARGTSRKIQLSRHCSSSDQSAANTTAYLQVKQHMRLCMFVDLSVCLSDCPSVHLCVFLSVCLSVYLPVCLPACLSICLSVYLSVYLSVCLLI